MSGRPTGPRSPRECSRSAPAYDPDVTAVQLNLLGSHDTPRLRTVLGGDVAAVRLAMLLQATLPGAPCLYYGDEIGLLGGNDPANRGAFPWDEARWDIGLRETVRALLRLRAAEPGLRDVSVRTVGAEGSAVAFERGVGDDALRRCGQRRRLGRPARVAVRRRAGRRRRPSGRGRAAGVRATGRDADRRRRRRDRPRGAERGGPARPLSAARTGARDAGGSISGIAVILPGLWQIYRSTSDPGLPSSSPGSSMSRRRSRGRSRHWVRSGDEMCSCSTATMGSVPGNSPSSAGGSRSRGRTGRPGSTRPTHRAMSWSACGARSARVWRTTSPRRGACCGRTAGCWSSTTTAGTTSRGCAATSPSTGLWSRRDGPFLDGGFKVRVVHCFWTFESIEAATTFLGEAFGAVGREVAAGMKRPRLSYNVAVYHRSFEADA